MLTRTQNRWATAGAALVLGLGALTAAPAATAAEDGARCDSLFTGGSECEVQATQPVMPGGTAPEGGAAPAQPVAGDPKRANFCDVNLPEGSTRDWKVPLSCETNWDPVDECIWTTMSPQPAPPAGADPTRGAWEECKPLEGTLLLGQQAKVRWWESTAAGSASPAEAARTVVARLPLEGIEMGMVPKPEAEDGVGAVGLPAWMWVKNTDDPAAWGPYTATESVDGLEVTATATPLFVTWDMGDGTQVVCEGPGTPYERSFGKKESPTCGHTYMEMGNYTVTAITTWSVEWSAGGESGVIETLTRSSQPVKIGEFHALNVKP
ncbi:hypothetical protein [Micrococcus luteus]|uniref:hypothetical protein n=1 Tax=Micrococcus luteus TaxID=1270 RepID=UPI00044E5DE7|nr:hypothetical protein [Micrococcus luteus]EZP59440.1 putative ATP/GTP-binding protein [Micrococcus luteus]